MEKLRCDKPGEMTQHFKLAQLWEAVDVTRAATLAGIASSTLPPSAGQSMALRPGEPLSKSSFGGAACERFLSGAGSDKSVDLLSLVHFGDAHQEGNLSAPDTIAPRRCRERFSAPRKRRTAAVRSSD